MASCERVRRRIRVLLVRSVVRDSKASPGQARVKTSPSSAQNWPRRIPNIGSDRGHAGKSCAGADSSQPCEAPPARIDLRTRFRPGDPTRPAVSGDGEGPDVRPFVQEGIRIGGRRSSRRDFVRRAASTRRRCRVGGILLVFSLGSNLWRARFVGAWRSSDGWFSISVACGVCVGGCGNGCVRPWCLWWWLRADPGAGNSRAREG
jgi:hypothetical protein